MMNQLQRVVVITVMIGCLLYGIVFYVGTRKMDQRQTFTMLPVVTTTKLLYLVQTDSCLPDHLLSVKTIGNAESCHCDVLVLSFKQECSKNPLEHVDYIFNSSATSWNRGRNLLFEETRKRGKYLYYIFIDDDIGLIIKQKNVNPWRVFETFLEQIEPAIGIVEMETLHLPLVYNGRIEQNCTLDEIPDYLPIVHFDSAFNAFHYKAVDSILPYPTKFDNISWWFSGWYAAVKSEVVFAGQTLVHTKVFADNFNHRPYPRKHPSRKDWIAIMKEIEISLPEKYRNLSLFLEWKKGHEREQTSPTLCLLPPPPHMPIKPFGYLQS